MKHFRLIKNIYTKHFVQNQTGNYGHFIQRQTVIYAVRSVSSHLTLQLQMNRVICELFDA